MIPHESINKKVALLISLSIALLLILVLGFWALSTSRRAAVTSNTPVSSQKKSQLVIAAATTDNLTYFYFDIGKHSLIEKKEIAKGGFGSQTNIENPKVSFASTGASYYRDEQLGGLSGNSPTYSRIYTSPGNLLIAEKLDNFLFGKWLTTKDGSKLYLGVPAANSTDSNQIYDLILVNTATKKEEKIAALGKASTRLFLSGDETKILVGEARERVENNDHFHDYYAKTVDLATKTVTEKLIWQDNGQVINFWSLDNLSFSPNQLKAVTDYKIGQDEKTTLRTLDLATTEQKDIYTLQGNGQANTADWSPDGTKILFTVGSYGETMPADQGIVQYDFNTGKSTQLIKTTATVAKGGVISGLVAQIIEGTFDGSSFAYSLVSGGRADTSDIYYYDSSQSKSYLIAAKVPTPISGYSY